MSGKPLQNRIALVTGASRGIGAAVARSFAAQGAHVILVARTAGALEEIYDDIVAREGMATSVVLDLTQHNKIDELGAVIAERFGKVDVLVGNAAALGDLTPLAHADVSMWERVISTNLTANWRLIRSFDPLLRASDAGRAMFVTSGVAAEVHPYWGAYAVSKAAMETLVKTYAAEAAQTNVRINLIDPGVVRTRMRENAMPGEDPSQLPAPDNVTGIFLKLASPECKETGKIFFAQK